MKQGLFAASTVLICSYELAMKDIKAIYDDAAV